MVHAVILDMDGTLTQPVIDWKRLRSRIGAPPESTIMDHIASLPAAEARRAEDILLQTEKEGTDHAPLNEGVEELFDTLDRKAIPRAIVTNNHRAAMQAVIDRHQLRLDAAFSRDDGPLKPAPDLILMALEALGSTPSNTLALGDGRYDIAACQAAGVECVYLTHGAPTLDHEPSISTLSEFLRFLS